MKILLSILFAIGFASAYNIRDTKIHQVDADVSGTVSVNEKSKARKLAEQLEDRIDYYEGRFGTDKAWALSLIEISESEKKSILQIYADYYRDRCPENVLTNAEMDFKTVQMLKDLGFKNNGSSWSFEGQRARVGKAHSGNVDKKHMPVDLSLDIKASFTENNSILIKVRTNMPDENFLTITVSSDIDKEQFYKVDSVYVRNGIAEMELFPFQISKGTFSIAISDPTGMGEPTSKYFDAPKTCGKNTRLNQFLGDRRYIRLIKKEILRVRKDWKNSEVASGFKVRKNERIKHVIENDADIIDSRDGKIYRTVKIGKNIWMAENLNYASQASSCYDEKESNCEKYGRLYNWEDARAVCPNGWRLPEKEDFEDLISVVENENAEFLKSTTGWPYHAGNNELGFNALPAGKISFSFGKKDKKIFRDLGESAFFWSNTVIKSKAIPRAVNLFLTDSKYHYHHYQKPLIDVTELDQFISVRCVKK